MPDIRVRVYQSDANVVVVLDDGLRELAVHCYPWPNDADIREKMLRKAVEFASKLSRFLNVELIVAIERGAVTAGLPARNAYARRLALRASFAMKAMPSLALSLFLVATLAWADSYPFAFDSCIYRDGPITLQAKAYDAAGNVGADTITVNLVHRPNAVIGYPLNGQKVAGQLVIQATSASPCACSQTLTIDGKVVASGACGAIAFNWFATKAGKGKHIIVLTATNSNGDSASQQINVTV